MKRDTEAKDGNPLSRRGARRVADTERHDGVSLTPEDHEQYLDLLDDEEDSQNPAVTARLQEAVAGASEERVSLDAYLERRAAEA